MFGKLKIPLIKHTSCQLSIWWPVRLFTENEGHQLTSGDQLREFLKINPWRRGL